MLVALLAAAVVLALTVAVTTGALDAGSLDARIAADVYDQMLRHPGVVQASRVVTWLGSGVVTYGIVVIAVVGLWLTGRRAAAAYVVGLRLTVQVATLLLKHAVDRPRPLFHQTFIHVAGPSFPSGHASGAASTYLPLALVSCALLRRAGWRSAVMAIAVTICLAVAATRVLLGVHYVSDVVAGLALGAAATAAFWRGPMPRFSAATKPLAAERARKSCE